MPIVLFFFLLEGSSMVSIITTDAIGCRVRLRWKDRFLCKVVRGTAEDGTDDSLTPEQREEMGKAGRAKMVLEFDERIVIDRYLAAIEEIASTEKRRSGFRISS
jgi:hypothetical protein